MATAGTPASARPVSSLSASRACHPGATAAASVNSPAENIAAIINGRRPIRSDRTPANRMAIASGPVASDTAKDAPSALSA